MNLSAMQEKYIKINNLQVSEKLSNFVNDELLKDTNVSSENFWLGLQKGEDLDSRIERNFGMMRPEGYRKTIRLMNLSLIHI